LRARAGAGLALLCLIAGAVWAAAGSVEEVLAEDVRPPIWAGAADMVAARPLTGFGYGAFEYTYPPYRHPGYFARPKAVPITRNAHSEPLQIAAESGLPAAAAFVILTLLSVSLALREGLCRRDVLAFGFGLALLCLFVHNLVDVNMRFASGMMLYWLLSGACWASAAVSEETGESVEEAADATAGSWVLGKIPLAVLLMALGVGSAVWTAAVPLRAGVHLRRGVEAREEGLWQTAVGSYRDSVKADPYQMEARQRLGFGLAQLGELERAAEVYADALALVPCYADLERDFGSVLAALDRFDEALERLTAWLERDPYDDRALLVLTSVLVETGRREQALESAERLVALRPELVDATSVVEQLETLAGGEGDEAPGP
jgi:tetratricopeptide (TPR) repeat protein